MPWARAASAGPRLWAAAVARLARTRLHRGCTGAAEARRRPAAMRPPVIRRYFRLTYPPGTRTLTPVYAVVATVRIEDPGLARAALADLRVDLVPRAPGFVSAYWLEPIDGVGMSVIVFETKEHAEQGLAYPLPPLPGVTPLTRGIREVYASA